MAETTYQRYRLGPRTSADLDALANATGSRAQSVRECVAYWHHLVAQAGRDNAKTFSRDDWMRLGHIDPTDPLPEEYYAEEERTLVIDWAKRIAVELATLFDGKSILLPLHVAEKKACCALAERVGRLDLVHGYALAACLRAFWRMTDTSAQEWWQPEIWLSVLPTKESGL